MFGNVFLDYSAREAKPDRKCDIAMPDDNSPYQSKCQRCPRKNFIFIIIVTSSLFEVAGILQSKQKAGLSEQQQDYIFQTKVVNSAQDFTTSTH